MATANDRQSIPWSQWSQFSESWRNSGQLARVHAIGHENIQGKASTTCNFAVARCEFAEATEIPHATHWLSHEPNLRSPYLPYLNQLHSPFSRRRVFPRQCTRVKDRCPDRRRHARFPIVNTEVLDQRIESLNRRVNRRIVQIYLDSLYHDIS